MQTASPALRAPSLQTKPLSFQDIILRLHSYWSAQGCLILQPYDMEVGAGTFHPATTLRALGPKPWKAAYVQPSRRPSDGRYGENPNRLQHYYQYQVILKPSPADPQALLLDAYRAIGIDPQVHDFRFVEDDWESPTLGAWGLGWEVWCDGMEVTPVHLFPAGRRHRLRSAVLRADLRPGAAGDVPAGRGERLRPRLQRRQGVKPTATCSCAPSASTAPTISNIAEPRCCSATSRMPRRNAPRCWSDELALPAYDQCIKASHLFNLLDARGAISVTERAAYIGRVRALAKGCCEAWLQASRTRRQRPMGTPGALA